MTQDASTTTPDPAQGSHSLLRETLPCAVIRIWAFSLHMSRVTTVSESDHFAIHRPPPRVKRDGDVGWNDSNQTRRTCHHSWNCGQRSSGLKRNLKIPSISTDPPRFTAEPLSSIESNVTCQWLTAVSPLVAMI